jgi:putative mRNA 3-end processing factor
VAAGGPGRHHPCPRRPRALGPPALPGIRASVGILKSRLGADINIDGLEYGERVVHNGVTISLHPAGHVLGSAQVRMEHEGEIWVASGDYKVEPDATCAPFEPVRCHTFITESTFGLPIYRWDPQQEVFDDINAWWRRNADEGPHQRAVRLRLRQGPAHAVRPGHLDRADRLPRRGRAAEPRLPRRRRRLPPTQMVSETGKDEMKRALVLAPPSAAGSTWTRASATTAMPSPAAGCCCAARAGGAASTAASCCPTTPTGPAC